MKTEKKTVQDLITERGGLINKREGLSVKMNEIIDKASAEKRDFTPEEEAKYKSLEREFEQVSRDIAMNNDLLFASKNGFVENKSKNAMFREFLQEVKGKRSSSECILQREFAGLDTAAIASGGMIPLTIKDVLPPLEMGLIFDKVGIPVQTGVTGDIQWPVLGSVEAEIKGETEALTDQDIDLSKINAKHVRLGISIKISNQAINDSYTDLVSLVQSQIRAGLNRTLNRVIFSHQNFTSDLHGPFASAKASGAFAGATPTYKELLEMKGKIASTGVEMIGFCYIMSEAMKAALEATPVDAGSGRMIIENGAIAGYPVFCTEYINYGSSKEKADVEYVAAGCFGYLPTNQHGEVRMIFDPYTQAKNDVIVITMNADWSITTLRKEAFALYKTAGA